MHVNAEKNGIKWSTINDERITFIGKIIRTTRIDELPQLFSVIKGDMSLIGPRPERPNIDNILREEIPNYDLRYLIKHLAHKIRSHEPITLLAFFLLIFLFFLVAQAIFGLQNLCCPLDIFYIH